MTDNGSETEGKTQLKGVHFLGYYGARKQRTSLSLQTKLEVIKFAEHNPSVTQNKIASHFGIDRTTVSKVLKRKDIFKTSNLEDARSDSNSPSDSQAPDARTGHVSVPSAPRLSAARLRNAEQVKMPFLLNQPSAALYDKCESWFLKQKFATLSKKYEKDIIAYSCLVNPLPLSIEACDKIILAKFLLDHGVQWLLQQIRASHSPQKGSVFRKI